MVNARDWWEISMLSTNHSERIGYPTQKPLSLLERIVKASSNPRDVVLDPFCGSGTALVAAQALGRQWIGIDSNHDAVRLSRSRLAGWLLCSPRARVHGRRRSGHVGPYGAGR